MVNEGKSVLSHHILDKHEVKMSEKLDNFRVGIVLKCNRDDLNMYEIFFSKSKSEQK